MPEMNFKTNILPTQDNTYSLGSQSYRWKINDITMPTFDTIYPVGSIYLSINNTDPGTLFGGTWEQIEDSFLLSAGTTYTAGDTGGSATMAHTHDQVATTSGGPSQTNTGGTSLSVANMPAHNHNSRSLSGRMVFRKYSTTSGFMWLPGGDSVTSDGIVSRARNHSSGSAYLNPSWGSSGYIDLITINATHTHDTQGSGTAHTHTLNAHTHSTSATTTGPASNNNNMPPYLVVYMWKRIA